MRVKPPVTYERNRVLFSLVGQRVFFAPKVKVLANGVRLVVGKKFDVTEDLQPYLLKRYRQKVTS